MNSNPDFTAGSSGSPESICAAELKKLRLKVTAEDRKFAMKELKVSYITIGRYTGGRVANLVLGISLLSIYRTRIKEREHRLLELCG
jgi:hypothetical protein